GQVILRTNGADTDNNSADFGLGTPAPHNLSMSPAPDNSATGSGTTDPNSSQDTTNPNTTTDNSTPDTSATDTGSNSSGASGGSSTPAYSNSVVISEFLPNPDGPDDGEEWIELYNNSDSSVDLSKWILDDSSKDGSIGSSAYTLPAGSIVAADAYFVVDLPEKSFALNNTGGDTVRLFHPDKQLVTQVSYTGNAAVDTTYA